MKKLFEVRNGFRDRVIRLYQYPVINVWAKLVLMFIVMLILQAPALVAAGVAVAASPFALLKFDKEGLSGDNEKFFIDLQKRISLEPESKAKEEIIKIIEEASKDAFEMAKRVKELALDDDKIKILKEFLGTDDKGVRSILQKQGEVLKKLEENSSRIPADMSLRAQVVKWQESNKANLAKLKAGEQVGLTPLEIRVVTSPMLPANTLGASAYIPRPEYETGVTELIRPRLTFWDYITKGRASSAVYVWVNKTNPQGAAAWIGPGVAKPGVSLELASEISNAKKVAASEKVALELLEDVDGFASYLEQELRFQVDKETNAKLISNAGSATSPKGIRNYSVVYSLAGVVTENPNHWDAIRAAVAQLRAGELDGAVTVFVNPVDKANMDLTKAISQGQRFIPAPPDAVIVEDSNIPVGYFQAAMLQYYVVKIYKDYTVTYGWENDDFTKNLVTLVGERRLHQYVKTPHTGAFIYDTFANVKTAIDGVI